MKDALRLRPGTPDDFPAIIDLLGVVFHEEIPDEIRAAEEAVWEPERALVVEDAGAVVAHTNILTRDLTVPGGIVPAAHVTGVGVLPTHRRRGLMTQMMHRQLRDVAEAGREPIAALWASETKIYPRFGYGPASHRLSLTIMNREVRLPAPPAEPTGQLRMGDPAELLPAFTKVYEQVRPGRVGLSSRDDRRWTVMLADPKDGRDGATRQYAVVYEGAGGPTGYALWRVKDNWSNHGPNAEVQVREVIAADPEAYLALWRFLLGVDLSRSVSVRLAAVDEPLQFLVDEPRRLGPAILDGLWIRLVDLPRALTARRYAAPVDVVLDVTDPLLEQNTGRWRLTGGPDGATCERTTDPADLACTITELGAAHLGATSLASLAAAGRVRQLTGNDPSAAFAWHRQPGPVEVF